MEQFKPVCTRRETNFHKVLLFHREGLYAERILVFHWISLRRSATKIISSRWTFTGILNLFCDLDLVHNRAIQSFYKTIHLMIMCHQTKFSWKGISNSNNILKRNILFIFSISVTLTLKTANQSFWKTIWLLMMHHHTKLGSKWFCVSKDIIWTNIHWHFKILLWPWPWKQQSDFSIKHSGLW